MVHVCVYVYTSCVCVCVQLLVHVLATSPTLESARVFIGLSCIVYNSVIDLNIVFDNIQDLSLPYKVQDSAEYKGA